MASAMAWRHADTCSSVTVTGGDYPGVYSLGDGDTYVSNDDAARVLRPVAFGEMG